MAYYLQVTANFPFSGLMIDNLWLNYTVELSRTLHSWSWVEDVLENRLEKPRILFFC